MAGRFIKVYEKLLKWEWYHDTNTVRLFLHLLLKANYKDVMFQGRKIHRGEFVTSLTSISADTGLSIRQVRDSLDKLKMTGEVTSTAYPKYRVISILRYDDYQGSDKQDDKQMTSNTAVKRQANDKQNDKQNGSQTSRQMTTSIEYIEPIEKVEQVDSPTERGRAKRFTPPTKEEILDYCLEQGYGIDVDKLYDHYVSVGWKVSGTPMKDWKAAVRNWARRDKDFQKASRPQAKVPAQDYEQRSYSSVDDEAYDRLIARLEGRNDDAV